MTSATLPTGNVGTAYSRALTVNDAVNPVTYTVTGGSLPLGVSLSGATLTGTPIRAGTYSFTIRAQDSRPSPSTASRTFTMTVTPNPPSVTTAAATAIGTGSATLGGDVTADGGGDIITRGVVWSTSPNPTLPAPAGFSQTAPGTTGAFTVEAANLAPGVTYYARAFATNSGHTVYGTDTTFTALQLTQSITFDELPDVTYTTETFTLAASTDAPLPVAFSATTPTVCTVDGSTLTLLRSGTCTVQATQPGNVTYAPASPVNQTFAIAKAEQTITFSAPAPRVYAPETFDVSASAAPSALPVSLTSDDALVCTVDGSTVRVHAAGTCTLTALQAGDDRYQPALAVVGAFTIAPRVLSLSGSRTYDGTTTVAASDLTATGFAPGETLTITGVASVASASPDVGAHLVLDVSSIILDDGDGGGRAANYVLTGGDHTLNITPRPVRGAFSVNGRVYDGTTSLADTNVTGRALGVVPGVAASGIVSVDGVPDDVTLTGGTATFAAAAASEDVPTVVQLSGAVLSGARASNYTLDSVTPTTATITRRPLTVTGTFAAADREYDGTTASTLSGNALTLVNTIDGDEVALTPTIAFDTPDAGEDRVVRLTGATNLTGAAAANYRLELAGAPTTTATIARRPLTVASGTFTVATKTYDGTTAATLLGDTLVLDGFAPGDTMDDLTWTPSAVFQQREAGTDRTVELVGGDVFTGAKGGNYTLTTTGAATATATILPRAVTVVGATALSRPYNGTTAVTVTGATLANTIAGDAVSLANATSGTAGSPDAGTRTVATSMTLTGAAAANYRLTAQPSLRVAITPLPVQVSMNPLPARPYDGTTTLPLTAAAFRVSGVLPGETITLTGTAQLSSRAAGTRTVTLSTPTFTAGAGTTLTNYVLPTAVTGSVTVTPLPVRIVDANVTTRAWDGTTRATIVGARLDGVRAGDNVSLASAASGVFASAQPRTHAVTFTPTLAGVDALNYTLTAPTLTGTITRAPATLRITGGLVQFTHGAPRPVRAAVSPASAGRVVINYPNGIAPSAPGSYPVTVTLESATHAAEPITATLTLRDLDMLLQPTPKLNVAPGSADTLLPPDGEQTRSDAALARLAVRPDASLAFPELGPILEDDGTTPTFAPNEHRVLTDGTPTPARVVVVEDRIVRIETDDAGLSIQLQSSMSSADGNVPLSVSADGTLLLDRDGLVEIGGSGFLPGSTAEVWIFSTATFLGTALVAPDGTFEGAFPIDRMLDAGTHTLQLNGIGPDATVRSTALGVRIDDPNHPASDRVVIASASDRGVPTGPLGLLALAALLGAAIMRWWMHGMRERLERS